MQSFNTTIGVSANASSAGQPVDFDGASVRGVVVSNNSGAAIQYTLDGASWFTVASGASAYPQVSNPSAFRLRKSSADSYPAPVSMSWTASAFSRDPARRSGATAVYMGDSIVNNGSNPTNGVRNARSVLQHAMRKLGRPFTILQETGYPGETTESIFGKWDAVVTANDPDVVFWESGVNDFSAGASADVVFQRLVAVHDRAVAEGRRFVYVGFPPVAFGARSGKLLSLVRRKAQTTPTFEYAGGWERLLDYNTTTAGTAAPTLIANALPDGTHPSAKAALLWGDGIADYLRSQGTGARALFTPYGSTGSAGDYEDNLTIGGLVGSSAPGFSTISTPTGARTAAASVVAMGNTGLQRGLPGRLYQVVWTPGTSPANADRMEMRLTSDFNGGADRYAGKTVTARAYIKATATGGNIRGLQLNATVYTWAYSSIGSSIDNRYFDPNDTTNWSLETSEYEGFFETEPIVLPATWTSPTQMHTFMTAILYADPGATVTVQYGCVEIASSGSV